MRVGEVGGCWLWNQYVWYCAYTVLVIHIIFYYLTRICAYSIGDAVGACILRLSCYTAIATTTAAIVDQCIHRWCCCCELLWYECGCQWVLAHHGHPIVARVIQQIVVSITQCACYYIISICALFTPIYPCTVLSHAVGVRLESISYCTCLARTRIYTFYTITHPTRQASASIAI